MNATLPSLYGEIGRVLANQPHLGDPEAIDVGIRLTQDLLQELRIPALRQFGLGEGDVAAMVGLARKSSSMRYNPVALPEAAMAEVLRKAIG